MVLLRSGGDGTGCFVWAVQAIRGPQHDQVLAFVLLDAQDRETGRLDQVAVAQQFPLNGVELVVVQADRGKYRLTVFVAVLADDDVAAAQVLEVVGKSAERSHHGVRVPARLVLNAVALDGSLSEQIIQIER